MALSGNVSNARLASNGITLDALDKAASRAEQAALRLNASTTLPFNQSDFESQHPGWSLSAYRSSSASNSRPASADGTSTSCPRWSISSASKSIPASLIESSARQAKESPSDLLQSVPRPRGRPRKSASKDLDQARQHASEDARYLVKLGRHAVAGVHNRRHTFGDKVSRIPTHTVRLLNGNEYRIHAYRPSSPSNTPRVTDPKSPRRPKQCLSKEKARLARSGPYSASNDLLGSGPANQSENKKLRMIYHEVIDPVIQSMAIHYDGLYPNIDGSAICQEVCPPSSSTRLTIE